MCVYISSPGGPISLKVFPFDSLCKFPADMTPTPHMIEKKSKMNFLGFPTSLPLKTMFFPAIIKDSSDLEFYS